MQTGMESGEREVLNRMKRDPEKILSVQARNPCLMLRGGKKARETLAAKFASFCFINANWVPTVRWWDIVWSGEPKQRSTIRLGEHHIWCVRLGTSSQCLLLTGPNAGGKTVVLKTLGLLALLVGISVAVALSGGVCFFFCRVVV